MRHVPLIASAALALLCISGCGPLQERPRDVGPPSDTSVYTREICPNGLDDDGNGQVDETCACLTGETQRCFGGNPAMAGVGRCVWGQQACVGNVELGVWTECRGWGNAPACLDPGGGDTTRRRDGGLPSGGDDGGHATLDSGLPSGGDDGGGVRRDSGLPSGGDDGGLVRRDSGLPSGGDDGGGVRPDSGLPGGGDDAGRTCTCVPGQYRWCDTPLACAWGRQQCLPDSRWGTCVETTLRPAGCSGYFYNRNCCVSAGQCCQNFPYNNDSVGNCGGILMCR